MWNIDVFFIVSLKKKWNKNRFACGLRHLTLACLRGNGSCRMCYINISDSFILAAECFETNSKSPAVPWPVCHRPHLSWPPGLGPSLVHGIDLSITWARGLWWIELQNIDKMWLSLCKWPPVRLSVIRDLHIAHIISSPIPGIDIRYRWVGVRFIKISPIHG